MATAPATKWGYFNLVTISLVIVALDVIDDVVDDVVDDNDNEERHLSQPARDPG